MNILLVNPPIYDFTAYDYWLRPLGLLRAASFIDDTKSSIEKFDFLDRTIPSARNDSHRGKADKWLRGHYASAKIDKPEIFADIPRIFRRFGRPESEFETFLNTCGKKFDAALIQVTMTWWYLGAVEVIRTLKKHNPHIKIVLGGPYAMLAAEHAKTIGADEVCTSNDPSESFHALDIPLSRIKKPAPWQLYDKCLTGVIKLTDGCPFNCTYCGVSQMYSGFNFRDTDICIEEFLSQYELGARNFAFYDDALLHKPELGLWKFIDAVRAEIGEKKFAEINFHTPNALNARFLDKKTAKKLTNSNFRTFYIGMESFSEKFQQSTGSKVFADEFAAAVENLYAAGAKKGSITGYMVLGHPNCDSQQIQHTVKHANSLGVRVMAADFSPVPGTPDGELCKKYTDLSEPLNHNKTAFTIRRLGLKRSNELKMMIKKLNSRIGK